MAGEIQPQNGAPYWSGIVIGFSWGVAATIAFTAHQFSVAMQNVVQWCHR